MNFEPTTKRTVVSRRIAGRDAKTAAGVLARQINPSLFSRNAKALYGAAYMNQRIMALNTAELYLRALARAGYTVEKKGKLP